MTVEFTECMTCEGRGGEVQNDFDGDGVWMTPVTFFTPCDDCLGNALCPGCSRAIPADEATIANEDTDKWTCGACGWHIDWGRFERQVDWGY